jgi:hypothetical protein
LLHADVAALDRSHGVKRGSDDARIGDVQRDAESVNVPRVARDAPIAEVQAQEIDVRRRQRGEVVALQTA